MILSLWPAQCAGYFFRFYFFGVDKIDANPILQPEDAPRILAGDDSL